MDYCMLLKYSAEDKCYIVSVPDLPGCMADGESPNEAYDNIKLAIAEWEETAQSAGKPIPKPFFAQENF